MLLEHLALGTPFSRLLLRMTKSILHASLLIQEANLRTSAIFA